MPTVTILGAGGYIGLAVVKSFASAGWEVRAVARNAQQAPEITKAGGTPIIASVLDVSKWREAAKESSTVVMCAGSARTSPEEHRAMYDAIFQVTLETTREADM
jgi:nucleoside-diphosphate-sugar epimerase